MKTCLKFLFLCTLVFHVVTAVSAVFAGEWLVLVWIAAATLWMADSFWSSFRADRYYRELIEALEDVAQTGLKLFEQMMENSEIRVKIHKRKILRKRLHKMHFDRLRDAKKSAKIEQ